MATNANELSGSLQVKQMHIGEVSKPEKKPEIINASGEGFPIQIQLKHLAQNGSSVTKFEKKGPTRNLIQSQKFKNAEINSRQIVQQRAIMGQMSQQTQGQQFSLKNNEVSSLQLTSSIANQSQKAENKPNLQSQAPSSQFQSQQQTMVHPQSAKDAYDWQKSGKLKKDQPLFSKILEDSREAKSGLTAGYGYPTHYKRLKKERSSFKPGAMTTQQTWNPAHPQASDSCSKETKAINKNSYLDQKSSRPALQDLKQGSNLDPFFSNEKSSEQTFFTHDQKSKTKSGFNKDLSSVRGMGHEINIPQRDNINSLRGAQDDQKKLRPQTAKTASNQKHGKLPVFSQRNYEINKQAAQWSNANSKASLLNKKLKHTVLSQSNAQSQNFLLRFNHQKQLQQSQSSQHWRTGRVKDDMISTQRPGVFRNDGHLSLRPLQLQIDDEIEKNEAFNFQNSMTLMSSKKHLHTAKFSRALSSNPNKQRKLVSSQRHLFPKREKKVLQSQRDQVPQNQENITNFKMTKPASQPQIYKDEPQQFQVELRDSAHLPNEEGGEYFGPSMNRQEFYQTNYFANAAQSDYVGEQHPMVEHREILPNYDSARLNRNIKHIFKQNQGSSEFSEERCLQASIGSSHLHYNRHIKGMNGNNIQSFIEKKSQCKKFLLDDSLVEKQQRDLKRTTSNIKVQFTRINTIENKFFKPKKVRYQKMTQNPSRTKFLPGSEEEKKDPLKFRYGSDINILNLAESELSKVPSHIHEQVQSMTITSNPQNVPKAPTSQSVLHDQISLNQQEVKSEEPKIVDMTDQPALSYDNPRQVVTQDEIQTKIEEQEVSLGKESSKVKIFQQNRKSLKEEILNELYESGKKRFGSLSPESRTDEMIGPKTLQEYHSVSRLKHIPLIPDSKSGETRRKLVIDDIKKSQQNVYRTYKIRQIRKRFDKIRRYLSAASDHKRGLSPLIQPQRASSQVSDHKPAQRARSYEDFMRRNFFYFLKQKQFLMTQGMRIPSEQDMQNVYRVTKSMKREMRKLLKYGNLAQQVDQDPLPVSRQRLKESLKKKKTIKRLASFDNSIYTKGLGLQISHDPELVSNFFKSQYLQEHVFDEAIKKSSLNLKHTLKKQHPEQPADNYDEFMNKVIDIPPDRADLHEFELQYFVEFVDFWSFNDKFTCQQNKISDTNIECLMLECADFFHFATANQINILYYLYPQDVINKQAEHFSAVLKQSHRYLEKSQEVSDEYLDLSHVSVSIRVLKEALNQFKFSIPILFNLSVLKLVTGETLDTILILKKLNTFLPYDPQILYNLIFVQLLYGGYHQDITENFEKIEQEFIEYHNFVQKQEDEQQQERSNIVINKIYMMVGYAHEQIEKQRILNEQAAIEKGHESLVINFPMSGSQDHQSPHVFQSPKEPSKEQVQKILKKDKPEKEKTITKKSIMVAYDRHQKQKEEFMRGELGFEQQEMDKHAVEKQNLIVDKLKIERPEHKKRAFEPDRLAKKKNKDFSFACITSNQPVTPEYMRIQKYKYLNSNSIFPGDMLSFPEFQFNDRFKRCFDKQKFNMFKRQSIQSIQPVPTIETTIAELKSKIRKPANLDIKDTLSSPRNEQKQAEGIKKELRQRSKEIKERAYVASLIRDNPSAAIKRSLDFIQKLKQQQLKKEMESYKF